jgi:hypothetical protein
MRDLTVDEMVCVSGGDGTDFDFSGGSEETSYSYDMSTGTLTVIASQALGGATVTETVSTRGNTLNDVSVGVSDGGSADTVNFNPSNGHWSDNYTQQFSDGATVNVTVSPNQGGSATVTAVWRF